MEFQEIKQQIAQITSDKVKPPEIHQTLRNNETFLNKKLAENSVKKQSTLTNDKERKK